MIFSHTSVLLKETVDSLHIKPDGIYVDCTLGGGGHALAVLRRLSPMGKLIGIDQDADAIAAAGERLKDFSQNFIAVHDNYVHIQEILDRLGMDTVDGIYIDLGVSSFQLDTVERGFTYREDAPLDMRMDQRSAMTAADIVNTYSQERLTKIFRDYGEERFAARIAANIVKQREKKAIRSTFELTDIIRRSLPMKSQIEGGHPAKRTFQAIRIELNAELDVLSESLDGMIDRLKSGGRLSVITFHSLEDRIVKQAFKKNENPCTCPRDFPVCVCGKKSKGKVLTRKPILPSEEELDINSRSKSAKLRVFERS